MQSVLGHLGAQEKPGCLCAMKPQIGYKGKKKSLSKAMYEPSKGSWPKLTESVYFGWLHFEDPPTHHNGGRK